MSAYLTLIKDAVSIGVSYLKTQAENKLEEQKLKFVHLVGQKGAQVLYILVLKDAMGFAALTIVLSGAGLVVAHSFDMENLRENMRIALAYAAGLYFLLLAAFVFFTSKLPKIDAGASH